MLILWCFTVVVTFFKYFSIYTKAEKVTAVAQGQSHLNIIYWKKEREKWKRLLLLQCTADSLQDGKKRARRSHRVPQRRLLKFWFLCCVALVVIGNNLLPQAQLCSPSLRSTSKKIPETEIIESWFLQVCALIYCIHLTLNASLRNHSPHFCECH